MQGTASKLPRGFSTGKQLKMSVFFIHGPPKKPEGRLYWERHLYLEIYCISLLVVRAVFSTGKDDTFGCFRVHLCVIRRSSWLRFYASQIVCFLQSFWKKKNTECYTDSEFQCISCYIYNNKISKLTKPTQDIRTTMLFFSYDYIPYKFLSLMQVETQ